MLGQPLRVRAQTEGTYAFAVRAVGAVFELARPQDLAPWMEVVSPDTPLRDHA